MRRSDTILVTMIGLITGTAHAQDVPETPGIADKIADEFQPIGARIGSAFLYPEGRIEGTATDNILATDTGRRSDVYLTVRPALRVVAQPGVNRFTFFTYAEQNVHANISDENITEFGARGFARIGERKRTNYEFTASADRLTDSRENTNNIPEARSPIRRGRFAGEARMTQVFNRVSLMTMARALRVDYADAQTRSGVTIDQQYRNYTSVGAGIEARFEMKQRISALARASVDHLDYDFGPKSAAFNAMLDSNRDSNRIRAEIGLAYRDEGVIAADVTVGYLTRKFVRQPIALRNASGVSFSANLVWNYDPVTTLRLTADRDFLESAQRTISGLRATGSSLQAEHSPTKSLLLTVSGAIQYIEPNGPGRSRTEFSTAIGATYYLSRRYSLFASAKSGGRDSNDPTIVYRKLSFTGGIRATF